MNQAGRALISLLALALLTGCASVRARSAAENGETVEAEGWAPVDLKDAVGTRQRALAEAQKKAVERVTGVFLAASTRIDAAIAVRQRIMADVRGYVRRYDILGERVESGFHKIRIRALVMRRKLGEEASVMKGLESPPENSRISIVIRSSGPQADAWSAAADVAVRERLVARGFQVVKADVSSAAKPKLIIQGEALAHEIKDPRLGSFLSYRGKVVLEAIDPSTGDVIWRQSQEAAALGVDLDAAASQSIENAGALCGAAAADGLTAYLWRNF